MNRSMSFKAAFLGVLIVTLGTTIMRSSETTVEAKDLLSDVKNPMLISNNFPVLMKSMEQTLNDEDATKNCYIEYQITRRRIGRCVKLSDGMSGCVSGQLLNPLHPDCV
ncbi:hypothetical protein KM043_011174 [Ampulex compressa]|nr:hypothetical protein KM043_011174 [Ampulex compressa]